MVCLLKKVQLGKWFASTLVNFFPLNFVRSPQTTTAREVAALKGKSKPRRRLFPIKLISMLNIKSHSRQTRERFYPLRDIKVQANEKSWTKKESKPPTGTVHGLSPFVLSFSPSRPSVFIVRVIAGGILVIPNTLWVFCRVHVTFNWV